MVKRLFVASLLAFSFLFGLHSALVTPVYASTINGTKLSAKFPSFGDAVLAMNMNAVRIHLPSSTLLDSKDPHEVALDISGPAPVDLTQPIIISGYLMDLSTGQGIPNKSIKFSTSDDVYLGQTHTDDKGTFIMKINKDLPAGMYLAIASFKGAHLLTPATASTTFEVLPAIVRVETVPAIPGITFQMDGRLFQTGEDGSASIAINEVGVYRLEVLLDQYHNPSKQVEFGRWPEESYQPFKDVIVPTKSAIQVGLNVFHNVKLKFIDLNGLPVDPSRITAISIRSNQGDAFSLQPTDSPWLPTSRTAHRMIGLEETDLLYSVNSVTIDGSNVVNTAQQRFYIKEDDTWTISLLLYSLRVTAKDGIFASPVGMSIDVVFPNGETKNYPLDPSGMLEIHALARGIYRVSVIGAKGLGTSTPVALSRNQVVNLNIVTPLDLAVVGSTSVFLCVGLILYGRPWLLNFFLRKKRSPSKKISWSSIHEN